MSRIDVVPGVLHDGVIVDWIFVRKILTGTEVDFAAAATIILLPQNT